MEWVAWNLCHGVEHTVKSSSSVVWSLGPPLRDLADADCIVRRQTGKGGEVPVPSSHLQQGFMRQLLGRHSQASTCDKMEVEKQSETC